MTRRWYYVLNNYDQWIMVYSNQRPDKVKECYEIEPQLGWPVYDVIKEEDGTCVALLSETKLANFIDEQRRIAREQGWVFNLDLNL